MAASDTPAGGLPLFEAARAAGVEFAYEALPQDRFVRANGLRFHYLDWGSPDSPAMLLLHGFAQTCHTWDFAALSLCDRFRVLALDQRGHGDSDWARDGDYSLEAQQADLRAIIGELGVTELVLMGLSMGGRSSLVFAAEHPELVKALVVVDATPQLQPVGAQNVRRFVQEADELDSFDEFVARVKSYVPHRPEQQIRGGLIYNLKQLPSGRWTWKYDRALRSSRQPLWAEPGLEKRLWRSAELVECPTLLVRGAGSDVVSAEAAGHMCRRMQDCQLVTVEGAAHLVPGDNPAGFQRALAPFVDGLLP